MRLTEALKTKDTLTENGMATNSTSLSHCVDLFFKAGAMRAATDQEIIVAVTRSFTDDPERTLKILFWARDIRGGAGERRFFKVAFTHLAKLMPNLVTTYLPLFSEYGRWDDLLIFEDTKLEDDVLKLIKKNLNLADGLCAKWMPRKGSFANKLRKYMGFTPKQYRKMLVGLTNVVETSMCAKEYDKINYSKVPSLAMSRYGKAFYINDEKGFGKYLEALNNKDESVKINTGAVYPYDVIRSLREGSNAAEAQWDALPNYLEGSTERILPLIDVSGSMDSPCGGNTTCLDVAESLGLYISERNEGPFKDHFLTFSASPTLQHLQGSLRERLSQLDQADWDMNTDLEACFDLILNQALQHKVSEDEMPTKILILSDMEFDEATDCSNSWYQGGTAVSQWNPIAQEMIKDKFEKAGYQMPNIIYWNIQSRGNNVPVKFDEIGTALISGFSPAILTGILGGEDMSPLKIMDKVIFSERYAAVEYDGGSIYINLNKN